MSDPGPIRFMNADDAAPRYCRLCGRALVHRIRRTGYDDHTGQRQVEHQVVCPRMTGPFGWLRGTFHSWYFRSIRPHDGRPVWLEGDWR